MKRVSLSRSGFGLLLCWLLLVSSFPLYSDGLGTLNLLGKLRNIDANLQKAEKQLAILKQLLNEQEQISENLKLSLRAVEQQLMASKQSLVLLRKSLMKQTNISVSLREQIRLLENQVISLESTLNRLEANYEDLLKSCRRKMIGRAVIGFGIGLAVGSIGTIIVIRVIK